MAVAMKNAIFWDVASCGSCKNRRSLFLRSVLQLLDTANFVPGLLILFILKMEAIRSSEASVHIRTTHRQLPSC
jgi:hypothetical protein